MGSGPNHIEFLYLFDICRLFKTDFNVNFGTFRLWNQILIVLAGLISVLTSFGFRVVVCIGGDSGGRLFRHKSPPKNTRALGSDYGSCMAISRL